MADIRIGTCGYSYTEWAGPVYPEGAKRDDFIVIYAEMFSIGRKRHTTAPMGDSNRNALSEGQGAALTMRAGAGRAGSVEAGWRAFAGAKTRKPYPPCSERQNTAGDVL
jgi:hypothetical protein